MYDYKLDIWLHSINDFNIFNKLIENKQKTVFLY